MTEAEWLGATDPRPMLESLRGIATRRKIGLWVVACYRALLPAGARLLEAVDVVERYAEGAADDPELEAIHRTHHTSLILIRAPNDPCDFGVFVANNFRRRLKELPAALLRDVFAGPGCPPSVVVPAWLARDAGRVARLAVAAYEERLPSGDLDPARLALLADALEDASCEDRDLLRHLRSAGPHVRGCRAVDPILGKT